MENEQISLAEEEEEISEEEVYATLEEKEMAAKQKLKEGKDKEASLLFNEILVARIEEHGELAPQCASSYLSYGKSLLYRLQNAQDILSNVLKTKLEDGLAKSLQPKQSPTEQKGIAKGKIIDDTEENEEEPVPEEGESIPEIMEEAWQVLELARVIYSKDPNAKLQLAETYLNIGDLHMEGDNMKGALVEYEKCLELRQELLLPDDRKLADIHFSIGLCHQYEEHIKEGLEHFVLAKKILSTNVARLHLLEDKHKNSKEEIKPQDINFSKELAELQMILFELDGKIEELSQSDLLSYKKEVAAPVISTEFDKPVSNGPIINLGVFGHAHKDESSENKTTVHTGLAVKRKSDSISKENSNS